MKIAILYDSGAESWTDEDIRQVLEVVAGIGRILRERGHEVIRVPVRDGLAWLSKCRKADLVFNLCEGVGAVSRLESLVVGTLELTGVPFTGCRTRTISLCHNKPLVNSFLSAQGVPTPRWVQPRGHRVPADFPLPAFVKPAAEDASVGIDQGSVVTSRRALESRVVKLTEQFDDVIVQQYVHGREFAVGFVGDQTLPISEIDFSSMPDGAWPILSFDAKWNTGSAEDVGSQPVCPAKVPKVLSERLLGVAKQAWATVGGTGYGRVDMRVDEQNQPWVIEVNPNPDLSEDAGLARMARAAGWEYEELVLQIADAALAEAEQTASVALLAAGAKSRAESRSSTGRSTA